MSKVNAVLRQARKSLKDLNLLKVLQSEIQHELSSNPYEVSRSSSMGEFVVDCDLPQSQDVVLRRKYESGEEVAVSALLGPFRPDDSEREDSLYPRGVLMKVCLKKPGLSSMLQFDCSVYEKDGIGSGFKIHNAYCFQPSVGLGPSVYSPPFSDLDDELQVELKKYLVSKGIGESLTNFLLHHLHIREQAQYVDWLHKLESYVAKSE